MLTPLFAAGEKAGHTAPYKQPLSVLVVIYTVNLEVLLLERADHPGFWQSVTGSSEAGETLVETAIREVSEETGLNIQSHQIIDWQSQNIYEIYPQWRHRYSPATTHNTEHVFGLQLPHIVAVKLAPSEHLNYQWLAWQEAAALVFSPSNHAAILELPKRRNAT